MPVAQYYTVLDDVQSARRTLRRGGKAISATEVPLQAMWKQLWQKWTLDKPAALGDWLWDVFVVQLAALLDRLTLRRIVALIPVVILILAYAHRIPLPPELMLVGDVLAYIDIFSVIILLGFISRATAIVLGARQVARFSLRLASNALKGMQRLDFRHPREVGGKNQNLSGVRPKNEDDEGGVEGAFAFA